MNTIIFWLKKLHILPVYRIDVLRYARDNYIKSACLCFLLNYAKIEFGFSLDHFDVTFPLFNKENAKQFGASDRTYWWESSVWNTGRLDFLDWLIEQYKNDKTDLRKL